MKQIINEPTWQSTFNNPWTCMVLVCVIVTMFMLFHYYFTENKRISQREDELKKRNKY